MANVKFAMMSARSTSPIPNTKFRANEEARYCSKKNVEGVSRLPFSIAKGIACLDNVVGFGVCQHHTFENPRFIMEILHFKEGRMIMEYDWVKNEFYHTCNAEGMCFHLAEFMAAILSYQDPHGELAHHLGLLNFKEVITDKENFFISCDSLFHYGKEKFDNADIHENHSFHDVVVTEDLTRHIIKKEGSFTYRVECVPSGSDGFGSLVDDTFLPPRKDTLGIPKMEWDRELTEDEIKNMEKNASEMEKYHIQLKRKEHIALAKQMAKRKVFLSMFFGETGTAKTTIANAIAHHVGMPVYSYNFSVNSEEGNIIGQYVPDPEQAGKYKWQDGEFTKAFRKGGMFIGEEINYCKAGVLGSLNTALDDKAQLVLPNGEVIPRHPNFCMIACLNPRYVGVQPMNKAFENRFQRVYEFPQLSKEEQMDILMTRTGYKNRRVLESVIEVGHLIQAKIDSSQNDEAKISIRNLVEWVSDFQETEDILESAKSTVVCGTTVNDKEFREEVFEHIVKKKMSGVRV